MNKAVKLILLIIGIGLMGYGIFMLISPEASFSFGPINAEVQDNRNAYLTIGLGIVALIASLLGKKKA